MLAWEEYLVLKEVQRKPMGTPYLVREPPFPSEATLPLRAQKLSILPCLMRWIWERQEDPQVDSNTSIYPTGRWKHGWSTLWVHQWTGGGHQLGGAFGSSFQKGSSSELPVCSPYRGRGWG